MSQFTFQEEMKKLRRTGSCVQDKIFSIVLGLISGKHNYVFNKSTGVHVH